MVQKTIDAVIKSFYEHAWLFLGMFLYVAGVCCAALAVGATFKDFWVVIKRFSLIAPITVFYIAPIIPVWFFRACVSEWAKGRAHRGRAVIQNMSAQTKAFFARGDHWRGVMGIMALLPMILFFCIGKSLIPNLTDYSWDPALSDIDKWLHFGRYPHEFVTPLVQGLGIEKAVYLVYQRGWFYGLFIVQGFCVFLDQDPVRRMRMMWTMLLSFVVLGLLMALAFSSVGPIYYKAYHHSSIYQGVMDNMMSVDDRATSFYRFLLQQMKEQRILRVFTISAMPSLHVAMAFLNCLYFWKQGRLIWGVAVVFFITEMIGSVYLGWHYAIDGYVSIAAIWLIWWGTGKVIRRQKQRQPANSLT